MNLMDLLTPDRIRSVLTVSPSDLPDSVIMSYGLEDDIGVELDTRMPNWSTVSDSVTLRKLRLFVKYRAAAIVAATAPVFILKKSTDGNNEGQRSDKDGFLWLSDRLNKKADKIIADLIGADVSSYSFSLVGRVIPARDPVTEPREVQ